MTLQVDVPLPSRTVLARATRIARLHEEAGGDVAELFGALACMVAAIDMPLIAKVLAAMEKTVA